MAAQKLSRELYDALTELFEARLEKFYDEKVYDGDGISIGQSAWSAHNDAQAAFEKAFVEDE